MTRRPACPGERFVLTLHRNPGSHTRPRKRGSGKPVKVPGMSINDWMGRSPMLRANLAAEMVELARHEADEQECPSFLEGNPYIRVTYFYKDRRGRDWMNMGKQLLDAFEADDERKAGIIANDNDKTVLLDRPRIVEGDPNPRIEVTLIDTRGMTVDEVADLFRESALEQVRRLIG